ncbi:hypothetical protein M1E11_18735 [Bacillus sp. JZ8]
MISEKNLTDRLFNLYIRDYYIGMDDYNIYDGPFDNCLAEINDIESQLPSALVDCTHPEAMKNVLNGRVTVPFPFF